MLCDHAAQARDSNRVLDGILNKWIVDETDQLFSNRAGGFFGLDVIISSVVLWVLVVIEGRRAGMKRLWVPIAASLAVGVSLGLPLFLYMREQWLERSGGASARSGV